MTESIHTIIAQLDRIEKWTGIGSKEVLTITEASMYTGYAVASLYKMTARGQIPCYRQMGHTYFRKSELDAWMTERRVPTNAEIDAEAGRIVSAITGRAAKARRNHTTTNHI